MATFKLEFDMGDDAFAGESIGGEISRILGEYAEKFGDMSRNEIADFGREKVHDENGNSIGTIETYGVEPNWEAAENFVRELSREQCVEILEGVSIQCYDSEDVAQLREAVLQNIKDDTLDFNELESLY